MTIHLLLPQVLTALGLAGNVWVGHTSEHATEQRVLQVQRETEQQLSSRPDILNAVATGTRASDLYLELG